jgi:hypothetical protein
MVCSSQSDLDKVLAFLGEHSLTIHDHNAGRHTIKAQGTGKQIHSAFEVKLYRYESPFPKKRRHDTDPNTQTHIGFDGHVHVPRSLSGIITAVVGLDDRSITAPAQPSGNPNFTNALPPPTVAGHYDFPNAGAPDQVIGIAEFAPAGYLETDFSKCYFPSMPLGYNTTPTINSISLPGASNLGPTSFNSREVCVDIAVSGTVAQGATINVYFGNTTESAWYDFLNRVLVPGSEAQPTVVSISYLIVWLGNDGQLGSPTVPGSPPFIIHHLLRHLAYQGINVFVSSGDYGASLSTSPEVWYPATDPWVTACGGTVLGNPHGSPPKFEEWVWSDEGGVGNFSGASTGGSSAIFPIPPYQSAAGLTQIEDSSGKIYTNRFIPDIAGMNVMVGFFLNGVLQKPIWGTSLVAPLYAGLTAVVRSALGIRIGPLNPILYALRHVIFRDIRHGDNDPATGSAYFSAKPGFDACTGWGSIHGTRFLNEVAKLKFSKSLHFVVGKHVYALDEVEKVHSYPKAFDLILEGFTPNAVGAHKPTLTGPFSSLSGVNITIGPPEPEFPTKAFTPQRISYTCSVDFTNPAIHTKAHGGVFPSHGDPPITESLGATITVLGDTVVAHKTEFKLVTGPDHWNGHEETGEVAGLIYNRFGYFDGFLLRSENGKEEWFKGDKGSENILRFAWEKKAIISVLDEHHGHSPNSIILRRLHHA